MITIKERATITKEQHSITVDVGENVPEGEYEVEVVLKEVDRKQKGILNFPVSDVNIPPDSTFSREEIYGDDGR
jgi:hypothetical protein